MKKASVLSIKYILYDFIRVTAAPLLLWFRPKKLFLSRAAKKKICGGALLISNHIGMKDPMFLMLSVWYRRHHFIATKELFDTKFKKFLFGKVFRCIEIDRENFGLATFRQITDHLKAGELLTMFPEGKIIEGQQGVQAFKSGMVLMALKSNVPLIPVYIKRRKSVFSRLVVAYGEPVRMDAFSSGGIPTMEDINRAAEYLHAQEQELEKLCMAKKDSPKGAKK